MTGRLDTLTASAPGVATRADDHPPAPMTIFDSWRVLRPILQAQLDDIFESPNPNDTLLSGLLSRHSHLEMAMLLQPADTLADVKTKLESFFVTDEEWTNGREIKEAILRDVLRLSVTAAAEPAFPPI
jgi:hypothetical protein